MQIMFTRWCVNEEGRTRVSINPERVDCIEHYSDAFKHGGTGEQFAACSRIIMKGKQEYLVQGTVEIVCALCNSRSKDQ